MTIRLFNLAGTIISARYDGIRLSVILWSLLSLIDSIFYRPQRGLYLRKTSSTQILKVPIGRYTYVYPSGAVLDKNVK